MRLITAMAIIGVASTAGAATHRGGPRGATAVLQSKAGVTMGAAEIVRQRGRDVLKVRVSGQTPGEHGVHFHAIGRCDGPDFTSAGAHWNPGGKQHGLHNPAGPHQGDLPNIQVAADGRGTLTVPLSFRAARLFDADGTALIVHATADDYRTDPSGNSGGRVLCGVLQPAR